MNPKPEDSPQSATAPAHDRDFVRKPAKSLLSRMKRRHWALFVALLIVLGPCGSLVERYVLFLPTSPPRSERDALEQLLCSSFKLEWPDFSCSAGHAPTEGQAELAALMKEVFGEDTPFFLEEEDRVYSSIRSLTGGRRHVTYFVHGASDTLDKPRVIASVRVYYGVKSDSIVLYTVGIVRNSDQSTIWIPKPPHTLKKRTVD